MLPSVSEDSVIVSVAQVSALVGGLRGFVGEIAAGLRVDQKVMGVTVESLSNYTVVHEGRTFPVDVAANKEIAPVVVLGSVVAELALGSSSSPTQLVQRRSMCSSTAPDLPLPRPSLASSRPSASSTRLSGPSHQRTSRFEKTASSDAVSSGYTDKKDVAALKEHRALDKGIIFALGMCVCAP